MKITNGIFLFLFICIYMGGIMAHQDRSSSPNISTSSFSSWVKMHDQDSGLETLFPQIPIEITYDLFPSSHLPTGQLHIYSSAISKGVLISGVLHSQAVDETWLTQEKFKHFFNILIAPRILYFPKAFHHHQIFEIQEFTLDNSKDDNNPNNKFLQFTVLYDDNETKKEMKGIAQIRNQYLFFAFYLTTEKTFDVNLYNYFIQSFKIIE